MDWNPFDWTAEPFLALYAGAAVVLFLTAVLLRANWGPTTQPSGVLSDLELAYLAGGATRLGDVALLSLAARGAVSLADKTHKINVTDTSPLAAISGAASPLSFSPDMTRKRFQSALQPLVDHARSRLQALGLCPTDSETDAIRLYTLAPVGLLLAFGVLRVFIGASRHHPVGILVAFLAATAIAGAVLMRAPRRTRAGRNTLAAYLETHARAARAPRDDELLLAVALAGTVVLTGTAYASIHEASRAMSGDGGSSDSGGGSCGGGGGGGGCGGCS